MIWPKPRTPFGPSFSYRLAQAFSIVWKKSGPSFFDRLGLPPINHQPATTTTSKWVELRNHLTRANLAQATTGLIEGFNRAGFAQRLEVTK